MKSKILVGLQFFIILIMTLPLGESSQHLFIGITIIVLGVVLAFFALSRNSLTNFNIRPDIKEDAELITSGIYAYIRHPMYASVLIMMFGIVVLYPVKFEFIAYSVLVLVLVLKLLYEESLWKKKDEKYLKYMQTTKRIIPFIF